MISSALFATSGDLWPQALWHASSSSGNWDRIGVSGFADDEFSAAAFAEPLGLDLDYEGNLLIADAANHAIRKASLGSGGGSVSTIAGHPSSPGWIDGPAEQARFLAPVDVASAPGQSVYVLQSAAYSLAEAPDAASGHLPPTEWRTPPFGSSMRVGAWKWKRSGSQSTRSRASCAFGTGGSRGLNPNTGSTVMSAGDASM